MYFKKIELFGFKSFADKTKLVFEPGVTAIVGPNGVGKSNISDAIKWVLGEQSAKELRGGKMEDVIFNGTDVAQAVNIAEVSLTLSNEDKFLPIEYDEITITRRVFRSGESEYLLNKTQVRLKDIEDLLAGTGIGTSSYSVAEQGRMDRILDARPEDRREIFEEASGITKYKMKKKEALRKLEHTENNLARLADIINEVKRQINSIERQAKRAQKYQEEFFKLKELDVKLSAYRYKNIRGQKGTKDQEYEQLKQKEGTFAEKLNIHIHNLRDNRGELTNLDQELQDIRNRLMNVITTIDRNASNVNLNNERVKELTSRRASLSAEAEQIEAKIESLKEQISQMQKALDELKGKKDERETIVRQRREKLDSISSSNKECETIISQSKLNIMDNLANQSKARNEMSKIQGEIISLSHRHKRLAAEKEATSGEISIYNDKFKEAERLLTEQLEITNKHQAQLTQIQEGLKSLNAALKDIDGNTVSFEKLLVGCNSKLEILISLSEKEGLPLGVSAYLEMIKKSPDEKKAFLGILVDIIKVRPGYERAIEAAIGDELQSIVLKDNSAAIKAIDYLKNYQKGKASFIILDRCHSQKKSDASDITAPAIKDFIDSDEIYKGLISYLFDGIFFAESLEEAASIVKDSKSQHVKVVTKDGSRISYNKITGGGIGQAEYTGIIGRKARIEGLQNEAKDLKVKIEQSREKRDNLINKIDSCQKYLQLEEITLKEQEKKATQKESEKLRLEEEAKKLEEEFNLVELELDEILQQEHDLKDKDATVRERLSKLEAEHKNLEDAILDNQKTIEFNTVEKENLLISLTEAKTELSLLLDKYGSQESGISLLKDSLGKEEFNLKNRKNQVNEGVERVQFLTNETQRMMQENEILKQQKDQLNTKVTELEQKRYSIGVDLERAEEEAQAMQKDLDGLKSGISTLHVNTTELNYEANNIKERIFQAYKINLDDINATFGGNEEWGKIEEQVNEAKLAIESMGPVNLVAIDEHKELEERFNFLTSQQQDLLNAKESLHKAINKINCTTRKLFIETFEKIKIYFKDYFRLLFGGGAADIYLIDQADILESGIEIIVRPPGKKLQNISLLSGGEKALTSIALLFALFKVKPSPFCILDEIDAPLDEANIDRFSRILQEFINVSQFIIITHNKKTISIADVMYGITMEKSGISKIVSVKFTDKEDKKEIEAEIKAKSRPEAEAKINIESEEEDKEKEPTTI